MARREVDEYRERDGDLWVRWKNHHRDHGLTGDLVSDGIAEPRLFSRESPRLLFVMKEPNAWEEVDMRSQLNRGAKHLAWHNLARWAAGALDGFPLFVRVNQQGVKDAALKRIAVVNLKKAAGGSSSDPAVIEAFAFQDRELLREQIRQIDPTVIVACGRSVFGALMWLLELRVPDPREPRRAVAGRAEDDLAVVPWQHPASRRSATGLYSDFQERWESGGL